MIVVEDSDRSKSKRNVTEMLNDISNELDQCKIQFEAHTLSALEKFDKKCSTPLQLFY